MILRFLVIVFSTLNITSCYAQIPDVIVHNAIPYCMGGGKELLLDLIEPADRSVKRPAILFVHGGGWVAGNRQDYEFLTTAVAPRGYVTASVDYRLAQDAVFPAQVEDIKCAVRWLRAHAEEYAIDVDHIGAIGGSAGAHLVAMMAVTNGMQEYEGQGGYADQPSAIQAMILHGGVYDLTPAVTLKTIREDTRGVVNILLGEAAKNNPKSLEAASPIFYVNNRLPPSLLLHGQKDPIVFVQQAINMEEKLEAAGAESELVIIPNAGHADFGINPDETARIFFDFLDKNLKPRG